MSDPVELTVRRDHGAARMDPCPAAAGAGGHGPSGRV